MKRREDDDVYDYGYALRNSLKRLDESEIHSEAGKELIREFLEHLRAKRVSTGTLAKGTSDSHWVPAVNERRMDSKRTASGPTALITR